MKIYSDGKTRIIKGQFPKRFKLSNAGVDVPFLRTAEDTIRLSGEIPFGALDVLEIKKKKTAKPTKLDAQSVAIINKSDFDKIDLLNKKLAINQEQMNAHLSVLTEHEATLANLETQNAQAIEQTNESMTEMAKVFGKEIQADRERIKATAKSIANDIAVSSEVLNAKIEAHEKAKNPHKITKETIGLDKVENTSDLDKPVSKATQKALDKKADKSDIEDVRKEIKATEKKQERLVKSIDNANLYGGIGGNELPIGGKTGQILGKKSDKTGDYGWFDNSAKPKWGDIGGNINNQTDLKNALDAKQNVIDDLDTIRSGATSGSTALQPNSPITGATKCKITYDSNGLVTAGSDLEANDIPSLTISKISDITATASELNVLDGVTASTTELNYLDGVTSSIQTQLNGKQPTGNYMTTDTEQAVGAGATKTFNGRVNFIGTGDARAIYLSTDTRIEVYGTSRTVLGFANGTFLINHSSYPLNLRGSGARPAWNGTSYLALTSDIGNATLTIQKNGVVVDTFNANATSDKTINITVPTDTSDLTNNAGYITGINSSDVTTALGFTPYPDSNPDGYTSNVGTVTSVNNTSPDGNGNVSLTIPTVNNSTITITQGGTTKGSFTLNQSSGDTIDLDAGDTLPSQTGQSGKFLTTDGTDASWTELTNYVTTNTAQTISGNKTFSGSVSLGSSVTATTPSYSDSDTSVATTAMVHNLTDTMRSNCITEIPQDIKWELNNGTFTLKAGSVLTLPDGTQVTTTADKTATSTASAGSKLMLIVNPENSAISSYYKAAFFSGPTAPSTTYHYGWWYDTTNNVIKRTGDYGSTWTGSYCFPIAIATASGSGIESIDQVFNGVGYIGQSKFLLPSVKVLLATGINTDGSLKSTSFTNNSLQIVTSGGTYNRMMFLNNSSFQVTENAWYYREDTNLWYDQNDIPFTSGVVYLGDCFSQNDLITKFEIRQPVRIATVEMVNNYLSTLTGYDATATQTLKNVNGVFIWVTDS